MGASRYNAEGLIRDLDRLTFRANLNNIVKRFPDKANLLARVGRKVADLYPLKNDTKMAELPKDDGSYGGVGLFIYDLLPYAEGGDIKSRVTNRACLEHWWRFIASARTHLLLKGVRLWQRLLPL
jgi:hypothetical protein